MGMQTKRSPGRVGEGNPRALLRAGEVREIRRRYAEGGGGHRGGPSMNRLAEEHGVTPSAIWCVVHRKSWKHI